MNSSQRPLCLLFFLLLVYWPGRHRVHVTVCEAPLPPCLRSQFDPLPLHLLCQCTTNSGERTPLDANDSISR